MSEELLRANGLLAATRRLHAAVEALLCARSVEELEGLIVDVLPAATGYERVALLTPPGRSGPATILTALGYPSPSLAQVPRNSPLAPGGFIDAQRIGSGEDEDLPLAGVRGNYMVAPLRSRERVVAILYADALQEDADPADAAAAAAYLLDIVAIIRSNVVLQAERDRLVAELSALARTDALTELPNRRVFDERLEAELHRSARSRNPFALAIVDLDYFKAINDAHGHLAGDEALQRFAEALRSQARGVDFVGRFAGDEFALILVDVDRAVVESVVNRILETVRATTLSVPARISASIGIAMSFPVDSAQTIVERADAALYAAKQSGRDRAIFL